MKIVRYKKYIDQSVTKSLVVEDTSGNNVGTELATLSDGFTYVSVPKKLKLPKQPKEISTSVKTAALTAGQIKELKSKSPQVRLINERVQTLIRDKYTLEDELKLARISIGSLRKVYTEDASESQEIIDYQMDVEAARNWGRAEKKKLGL